MRYQIAAEDTYVFKKCDQEFTNCAFFFEIVDSLIKTSFPWEQTTNI